ncbi:MAG: SDR family oxidoreductase [candidate division Zixibacteria bacterium]|nr:SDR family oxidoreductase [candidate division Zixibacteria bacterium]
MDLGLNDKAVLVTASSAGIGKGIALAFAREGAKVMLMARRKDVLQRTRDDIAETCENAPEYYVGDMTNADDINGAITEVTRRFGGLYALVNNTGGPSAGGFAQFTDADWISAFELSLLSYVRTLRQALPIMAANGGGRVVNIASSSIRHALDNLLLSNTFRMGVVGLTKTLAREYGRHNILLNVIGPGKIATERVNHLDSIRAGKLNLALDEFQRRSAESIPLGRYGTPDELARLAVFLGSEANTFITGQCLLVDGGMVTAY